MADNILITMVSDQTVPNIVFVKEAIDKFGCNKFVFVTTKEMKEKNKTKNIQKVCNLSDESLQVLVVESDDFNDNLKKLNSLDIRNSDKIYANLTTGTKIMSLALFEFAKNYVKSENLYYFTFGKDTFVNILSGATYRVENKITIQEYLDAYGVNISNKDKLQNKKECAEKRKELTYQIWNLFNNNPSEIKENAEKIRTYFNSSKVKGKEKKINIEELKTNASYFINKLNLNFDNETKKRLKHWIEYLTGGWFEELIYFKTKEFLEIENNEYIQIGMEIEHGGKNELDVAVCYNNNLYYLECKTGLGEKERDVLTGTFYKLSHLKDNENFGLGMTNALISLDDKVLYDKKGELQAKYKDSVRYYRLKFFGWKDIKEKGLENIIKEIFNKGE
ncbi:Domain of unknown function DUF1887 [Flexistipes sinusarabici DSM 4947]|uniref:DUF1887 family protein n=1 Tax=Flexistipes sinusarabici (strain ATCC 49648 / DSM 4947 / MAS 10) TaxID=717231 RepID=F8E7K7_FLESM|nr:DUF1887 family CARF protein [Flexistipes sinusarabici]AEI14994.1 Domain of unknown function DUF1887 [Flexistipes sinusarabici DSM 4947]